jgi:sRNA-binding carbon storage regulator CsrA
MIINLQKQNESVIITLDDGEDIEFTQEDLARIGINAEKAIEMMKDELLEKLLPTIANDLI